MAYNGTGKMPMPSCNRLLERKWDAKKLQGHQDRLRSIKSTVDSSSPREYQHIRQNLRKAQIESDKQSIIQLHNQQLLERMDHIMHTTGRVDHRNLDWRPKRSLNFVKKQQEMDRLMQENMTMLKRIQYAKPLYNTSVWESDFRRHKSLIKNLSTLPPVKNHLKQSKTLPEPVRLHGSIKLPSLTNTHQPGSSKRVDNRPETDQSEIHEEIDVDGLTSDNAT